MIECPDCTKFFTNQRALEQHAAAVHTPLKYRCLKCDKAFKSSAAMSMHSQAVHSSTKSRNFRVKDYDDSKVSLSWRPDPPIDCHGRWVYREKFRGTKSFGFFLCKTCKKQWISAHAFRIYKQECQRCETSNFSIFLWENLEKRCFDEADSVLSEKGPHDMGRCEACRKGLCSYSLKY